MRTQPRPEPGMPVRVFTPVVVGGVGLIPPRRAGDCSCVFCSTVRGRHIWLRAVAASVVPPLLVWFAWEAHTRFDRVPTPGASEVIGGLLIVATMFGVLAITCWWTPIRRLRHRLHPRTHDWPPPAHG